MGRRRAACTDHIRLRLTRRPAAEFGRTACWSRWSHRIELPAAWQAVYVQVMGTGELGQGDC